MKSEMKKNDVWNFQMKKKWSLEKQKTKKTEK